MDNELVSVLVLAYNSADTILETLQSIYDQTYENIELVINDDCSKDTTTHIVNEWLELHKDRFVSVNLICNKENVGITRSLNNAVQVCTGEWIKSMGADDLLMPECIELYMDLVLKQCGKYDVYMGWLVAIDQNGEWVEDMMYGRCRLSKLALCEKAIDQYKMLLIEDVSMTPSIFFLKKSYLEVGGCDERIRNIEDHSLRLRLTKGGHMIGVCEKVVAKYRIHNSISRSMEQVYSLDFLSERRLTKKLNNYPNIPWCNLYYWISEFVEYIKEEVTIKVFRNKKSKALILTMKLLSAFSPRMWSGRKAKRDYLKSLST